MNEFSLSDLAAVTGGNRNGGNGWDNGGGWWILLLFILLGGFNGNRGYGGQGYGAGGVGGNELYPWLNNSEQINGGFRDQMIQTTLQGIQTQGQNLATQLCNCCGDMQMAIANGFAGVQQSMCNGFGNVNTNMMQGFNATQNTINQGFNGTQMGMMQGFNGIQAQTAQLASDIQLGNAQQTATILAENCADRAALSDGVRDIIQSNTANTQSIIDKLCQLEMDGYKREAEAEHRANDQLRAELTQARFDASQQAQNAFIQQGLTNEVDALYNRLSNCPVPSMPVYGRTPIFTCNGQNPCGCGCAA